MEHNRSIRPDLSQSLQEASKRLSTQTIMFHQTVAGYLGLNITDHKILDIVLGMGKATAGQLAELTGLTTGAITSALNRLEKSGYVRRTKDPKDLRIVLVEPLYGNLYMLIDAFAPLAEAMNELYSQYDPDELQVLLDYMEKANQILKHQTQRLRNQGRKRSRQK
ncbi:MarR family winged helix-turn-helix transcriptional regulator [Paenibacillus alkalitolerans]|uniref:MarR family winged helix-turn-helix transcriptional regulator n=1 Tax=Paenibacillus alkalitolerans TaxID=2799335 RepID=UPI0018F69E95|nr:MarR family transcriptional regulator [Paenibacillus alkalitolerans]